MVAAHPERPFSGVLAHLEEVQVSLGLSEGEERSLPQRTQQPGGEQRRLPQVAIETAPQLHGLLKSRSQGIRLQRADFKR